MKKQMTKMKKLRITAGSFLIVIITYSQSFESDKIRNRDILYIFTIGFMAGCLLTGIIDYYKNKRTNSTINSDSN